jgi:hypothetical protein
LPSGIAAGKSQLTVEREDFSGMAPDANRGVRDSMEQTPQAAQEQAAGHAASDD